MGIVICLFALTLGMGSLLYINTWIQLRSVILVLMRLLAMIQQKIPYEVF